MDNEKFYFYFIFFVIGILSITTLVYHQFSEQKTKVTGYATNQEESVLCTKPIFSFAIIISLIVVVLIIFLFWFLKKRKLKTSF